ncbi:MAG: hypothetical protein K2L11_09395 [Muribaculaceae bacterium]|nr:hypothetical protein [Muribaculaceae bacterium]
MVLLMTYKELVNLGTSLFIASGILLVIAAFINADALMRSIGFPTWREWWEDLKKH